VLNLAYNALLDGQRLEDIELRRNDEAFLDGLGAQCIPDPTTSGDFTRRFMRLQWGQDLVTHRALTSPTPRRFQTLSSSPCRTKPTDEEELLSKMGIKKIPDPERRSRRLYRSKKSSFKSVESDRYQIGPCIRFPTHRPQPGQPRHRAG
jgi:hypothetical protein